VVFCWFFAGTEAIASASTLAEIQRRGYLIVAVKDNLRPLGFRDQSGNLQGWEIDLAKHLASDLFGKADAVKFQPVNNQQRLSVVWNHKVDLAIARVTATESRSRLVSFSVPYYFDSAALITKNPSIVQLEDLSKRSVAVLNNSSTIAQVQYFIPEAKLQGVSSYLEARSQMENHRVDAFAADISVLSGWIQAYPEYKLIPTKLSAEPLAIVMPKGLQYDEFRRHVNEAIARYTVTGWLEKNSQKWGLP
jgi:polar amino acid transport system substrate-binding protein